MTTGISQRSVLVIGASQRVLDDCVAALRDLGYTAQGTNEFFSDITGRFDVPHINLVSLGGRVPPTARTSSNSRSSPSTRESSSSTPWRAYPA